MSAPSSGDRLQSYKIKRKIMENLLPLLHPKHTGQPFGIRHLTLQRENADCMSGFYLDTMVLQISPAGHINIMGSIAPHQEADLMRERDKGRTCTGRAPASLADTGVIVRALSVRA